jgi:hypothetical protein
MAPKIKIAHEMGRGLKAIQSAGMMVELRTAGYVTWVNSMRDIAEMCEWQDGLMDLDEGEYDLSSENESDKINRMVAWQVLKMSVKGLEVIIQTVMTDRVKDFNKAFMLIHEEYHSEEPASLIDMYSVLTGSDFTLRGTDKTILEFAALLDAKSRRLKELGGDEMGQTQKLAIFVKALPEPEYTHVIRMIRNEKTKTLMDAVRKARSFAVSEKLEAEIGEEEVFGLKKRNKKEHQIFFNDEKKPCRWFAKHGTCKFGDRCHFSHDGAPRSGGGGYSHSGAPRSGGGGYEERNKKFNGECRFCNMKGHKEAGCGKKLLEQQQKEQAKKPASGSVHWSDEKSGEHEGAGMFHMAEEDIQDNPFVMMMDEELPRTSLRLQKQAYAEFVDAFNFEKLQLWKKLKILKKLMWMEIWTLTM